ncbi:MAG: (deoxy)nucleoside triphosphate pyrophosphohydrolase [Caldimicrobium sp.]
MGLKVVSAFIQKQGKVLIVRRALHKKRGGLWEFPGGKVEEGETPEEAIVRELQEELNLIAKPKKIVAKVNYSYDDEDIELSLIEVEWEGEPELREDAELSWVKLEDLDKINLCEADRLFLHKLKFTNLKYK